jgi:hypothetical protein
MATKVTFLLPCANLLFEDGLHWVAGIKNNMKNRPMTMRDKILLWKRSVIKTINDELKNICEIEHSKYHSPVNFLVNLFARLAAYSQVKVLII